MRVGLICVGRLKSGPEREIYHRYSDRISGFRRLGLDGLALKEIDECKASSAQTRKLREAEDILAQLPQDAALAVFDERGSAADSLAFANFIGKERDSGRKALWCVIGGSEGLDPMLRARAQAVFSFGAMTLPHQLVRILAAEQIYRAMTILYGHPYHRGGE